MNQHSPQVNWTLEPPSGDSSRALLAQFIGVTRRRKILILLVLLGTLLGCYIALSFITDQYEAEARLLVKLGRENAEVPLTVDKGGVYATGIAKEEINSNIQLLTSRSLIEATVDQLGVESFMFRPVRPSGFFALLKYYAKQTYRWARGRWERTLILLDLAKDLNDREKAVSLLEKSVKAARERDSNVTIVKIRLPDPKLAARAMSTLLDLYLQRHIQVQREGNLREVFQEQSTTLGKQLDHLQGRITKVREEGNLRSVTEQRTQLLQRLDQLKRDIDTKTSQQRELESQTAALHARLAALPLNTKTQEVVEPSRGTRAIRDRLSELRVKRIETAAHYAENSRLVKNIDDEIAALEKMLITEEPTQAGDVTYQRNPMVAEFQAEAERTNVKQAGLVASIDEQRRQADAIQHELRRLDEGEDRLRLAELERHVLEEKYVASAARNSAARIAEDFDSAKVANVAVLAPPTVPAVPVYPPKLLIMGVALAAGLVLGLGFALVLEWASDIIHAPLDIATIDGLAFLGEFRFASADASRES